MLILKLAVEILILWVCYILYMAILVHRRGPLGGIFFYLKCVRDRTVELGCGDRRNAGALLKRWPDAKLTAVDYSALSVEKTKAYNREQIAAGRCTVLQGDVKSLPFADESFDLATAFETVYFWPGLTACFTEVCRVLRPGGTFLICNESDGTDETGLKFEKIIDGMKCHTVEELSAALKAAGFSGVTVDHFANKPWITVLARK